MRNRQVNHQPSCNQCLRAKPFERVQYKRQQNPGATNQDVPFPQWRALSASAKMGAKIGSNTCQASISPIQLKVYLVRFPGSMLPQLSFTLRFRQAILALFMGWEKADFELSRVFHSLLTCSRSCWAVVRAHECITLFRVWLEGRNESHLHQRLDPAAADGSSR
jgi:hypothetical protein